MGEPFVKFGKEFEVKPDDYKIASEFYDVAKELYASGKLVVHPPRVEKGGLKGIFDGLQMLKEGKVSGTKLVYPIA